MTKALTDNQKQNRKAAKFTINSTKISKLERKTASKKSGCSNIYNMARMYPLKPPTIVIIVPVRNRDDAQIIIKKIYNNSNILKLLFVKQKMGLPFCKGTMLNIGFREIKNLYPEIYKNITLVLHDVDVLPFEATSLNKNNLVKRWKTKTNEVKHIYGFSKSLGGVLSITASDFEIINGFPNIYGWGNEDLIFKQRTVDNMIIENNELCDIVDKTLNVKCTTLQLNHDICFANNPPYRIYFVSEFKMQHNPIDGCSPDSLNYKIRNCDNEQICTNNEIIVESFTTNHRNVPSTDLSNIKICSRNKLNKKQIYLKHEVKIKPDKEGWYNYTWNAQMHGQCY